MATNLYETLDINANATDEEVRRAYRRKALQTHPDRLPQTATAERKAAAEELFRKVNHAYEVLSNSQNRQAYDLHGVWPPPQAGGHRGPFDPTGPFPHPFRGNSFPFFPDPFFNSGGPFSNRMDPFSFGFTNPFSLFDSIFGYDSNSHTFRASHGSDPWGGDPFARMEAEMNNMFNVLPPPPPVFGSFGMGRGMGGFRNTTTASSPFGASMSWGSSNGGSVWSTGESFSTSTINGVTHSVHVRRDAQGNEHITKKYPDGREVYTINGVEQSSTGHGGHIMPGPQAQAQPLTLQSHQHHRSGIRSATSPVGHAPPPYPTQDDYRARRDHHRHWSRRRTDEHRQRSSQNAYMPRSDATNLD